MCLSTAKGERHWRYLVGGVYRDFLYSGGGYGGGGDHGAEVIVTVGCILHAPSCFPSTVSNGENGGLYR